MHGSINVFNQFGGHYSIKSINSQVISFEFISKYKAMAVVIVRVLLWRSTTGNFGGGFLSLLSFALLFILGLWIILIFSHQMTFGLYRIDGIVELLLGIISGWPRLWSFLGAANAFGRTYKLVPPLQL
jgi:hypothetical protein